MTDSAPPGAAGDPRPLLPDLHLAGPPAPRFLTDADPRTLPAERAEVLVIGGGVAGLSAAIVAAEHRDTYVVLKGDDDDTATGWFALSQDEPPRERENGAGAASSDGEPSNGEPSNGTGEEDER